MASWGRCFPKGHKVQAPSPWRLVGPTEVENSQPLKSGPSREPRSKGRRPSREPEKFLGHSRESRTDGKCISKEAQEFAPQEIISGKVQWGIVWNLKYSQFKRKEGLCSRSVRAGEAFGAGWVGTRGGQGGCLGKAGDQAGVELRVGPSLTLLVWNCRVHGPGPGLWSSVNPYPRRWLTGGHPAGSLPVSASGVNHQHIPLRLRHDHCGTLPLFPAANRERWRR